MLKPLKIAYVVHTAYPDFIGGRENHIHTLASSLSKEFKITVIASSRNNKKNIRTIGGYTLITLPNIALKLSSNPLQIYRIIPSLFSALRMESPDLIHIFEYGSFSTDIASLYCKIYKIPYILSVYGYQLNNPLLRAAKYLYDRIIGKPVCLGASSIFYPSDIQYREMVNIVGEKHNEKMRFQMHGIQTSEFANVVKTPALIDKYGLAGKTVILTSVRLLPRKGIKYLLLAIHDLVTKYQTEYFKLLIVGPDCGDVSSLQALIQQLDIEKYVLITGPVSHKEIGGFLGICDIFAYPSLYEGVPLSLIEAMASGKAVIFTDLPCAKLIISNGYDGVLVKPGDSNGLAAELLKLITDTQLREELGKNAREKSKLFDTKNEALTMKNIYLKLNSNNNK